MPADEEMARQSVEGQEMVNMNSTDGELRVRGWTEEKPWYRKQEILMVLAAVGSH